MNLTRAMIEQRMREHRRWMAEFEQGAIEPEPDGRRKPSAELCRECDAAAIYGGYCEYHARERLND